MNRSYQSLGLKKQSGLQVNQFSCGKQKLREKSFQAIKKEDLEGSNQDEDYIFLDESYSQSPNGQSPKNNSLLESSSPLNNLSSSPSSPETQHTDSSNSMLSFSSSPIGLGSTADSIVEIQQEGIAVEEFHKNGRFQKVYVVAKNVPFSFQARIPSNLVHGQTIGALASRFSVALCYDQPDCQPLKYVSHPPITQCLQIDEHPIGSLFAKRGRKKKRSEDEEDEVAPEDQQLQCLFPVATLTFFCRLHVLSSQHCESFFSHPRRRLPPPTPAFLLPLD